MERETRLICSGNDFRTLATTYIVAGLERGVPSLFVDIKSLYTNADKMKAVSEIVEDVVSKLEAETGLHGDGRLTAEAASSVTDGYRHRSSSHDLALGVLLLSTSPCSPKPSVSRIRPIIGPLGQGHQTYPDTARTLYGARYGSQARW